MKGFIKRVYLKVYNFFFKKEENPYKNCYQELMNIFNKGKKLSNRDLKVIKKNLYKLNKNKALIDKKFLALKDALKYRDAIKEKPFKLIDNDVSIWVNGKIIPGKIKAKDEPFYFSKRNMSQLDLNAPPARHDEKNCPDCILKKATESVEQRLQLEKKIKTEEKRKKRENLLSRLRYKYSSILKYVKIPFFGLLELDDEFELNELESEEQKEYLDYREEHKRRGAETEKRLQIERQERLKKEEQERLEKEEKLKKEEQEKLEKEEQEKLEKEEQEKLEKEKLEKEKLEKEKVEKDEKLKKEEQEKLEKEKLKKEEQEKLDKDEVLEIKEENNSKQIINPFSNSFENEPEKKDENKKNPFQNNKISLASNNSLENQNMPQNPFVFNQSTQNSFLNPQNPPVFNQSTENKFKFSENENFTPQKFKFSENQNMPQNPPAFNQSTQNSFLNPQNLSFPPQNNNFQNPLNQQFNFNSAQNNPFFRSEQNISPNTSLNPFINSDLDDMISNKRKYYEEKKTEPKTEFTDENNFQRDRITLPKNILEMGSNIFENNTSNENNRVRRARKR